MPFDPSRYPLNWKTEIRPRILAREGYRCKFCGILNGSIGWRVKRSGRFYTQEQVAAADILTEDRAYLGWALRKPAFRIILTIAHLDHALVNHRDENLVALCQRCHLNYDRPSCDAQRQAGKKYGPRTILKRIYGTLFDEETHSL
ncbi:hypothetical protein [Hymenobacter sp. BT190]|uniref:hypothetical protein n=1 Tax=Hymenobacter sp. BT190 TaxID=2763505 RepID=UPI00165114D9|nr:hypothetical protein [Hymenobacter sp. BT190]MBC6698060.1 hypothetical protein [Hymenobacter sp. BT190]